MSTEKVVVYTTNNQVEAEMIKQHLNNYQLDAFILNKQDSSYHFGEIEILVNKNDESAAKGHIEEFNENQ